MYGLYCYQFISIDGTLSAFDDSHLKDGAEWVSHIIPQGAQIRKVETLLGKKYGGLWGFKWIGDDGTVLLAVGAIDNPDYRNHPKLVLQTLTLNHNQRLVGVRSGSGGKKMTEHDSFQWVICTEE